MKRPTRATIFWAAVFALIAAAPWVLGAFHTYLLATWMIMALSALGLNIPMGLGAMYSFGQGGFMLIGSYATAVLMATLNLPFPVAFVAAVAIAALLGAVIGLPALRMSGFSLAIVTFSFAFLLFNLVKAFDLTGGPQGLVVPASALSRMWGGHGVFYVVLFCLAAGCLAFASVSTSKTGRALRTIGESELIARSLGISLTRYKIIAFVLSAAYAAAAGGLLALVTGFVAPETFAPELSINLFAAVVIGGIGSFAGPLVGSLFIVVIPELTQSVQNLGQVIYAALFCVTVVVIPGGLVGIVRLLGRLLRRSLPTGFRAFPRAL